MVLDSSARLDLCRRLVEATFAPVKPRQDGSSQYDHAVRVADRVATDHEKMVALLHDVLEDTGLPPEVIEVLFGAEVLKDVEMLTHKPGEGYRKYIHRIIVYGSTTAVLVKLADNADNQINTPTSLVARYEDARWRLERELSER